MSVQKPSNDPDSTFRECRGSALAQLALGSDLEGLVSFPIEWLDQPSIKREEQVFHSENTASWMEPIFRFLADSQLPENLEEA